MNPLQFELAAAAERMRVDRNGSIVSLLMVRFAQRVGPGNVDSNDEVAQLGSYLGERLRLTDTAGWLRDGRLGILLPDTAPSGAWKVASDLCELFPAGSGRPGCEVVTYPEHQEKAEYQTADLPHGEQPVPAAPLRATQYESLMTPKMPAWKRAIDLVGASVGLIVAGPMIVAAAVAIRATTPGKAFFLQEREGLGGRRFRIYKLRTMRPDAESLKAALRHQSEQDGPAFKMVSDPRITPLGRFLRKTSIDELPQLINVLRGEMSLVGPRPLPVEESLACLPWQRQRLNVTPGVTCIWQIHGRNRVSFDEWIRMDLKYAAKQSPLLDLHLVAKTAPSMIFSKGQ